MSKDPVQASGFPFVQLVLQASPSYGACFPFSNKAEVKTMMVPWGFYGFWRHYKPLETNRFVCPDQQDRPLGMN
ncbi:hypothetical protein ABB02_00099 [Clostridiaceae bacterium JG1575]|nr:hypothetical protein ABB02_00099 [Clostridiaceae bacterium JG1575]